MSVPAVLPPCIDALVATLALAGIDGDALTARVAAAVPPDAETGGIASDVVLRMLNDPALVDAGIDDPAVATSHAAIVALHDRALRGQTVARTDWTTARTAAVAAADAATGLAALIGQIAEAAAWPPARSRTVLSDTFRCWLVARDTVERSDDPWTPEHEARATEILSSITDDHRAAIDRGEPVPYPALFAARDPVLEQGYREKLSRGHSRSLRLAEAAADMLVAAVAAAPEDPYLWLEDIDGQVALDQVRAWNAATDAVVRGHAAFAGYETRARAILDDTRRIAFPTLFDGFVYNFWADADHLRGIWRRSPEAAYLAGTPAWDVLLDIDALCRDEGANWVWHGVQLLRPNGDRCLVSLSDGGRDAVTWREFDLTTRSFVADGFVVPEAKTRLAWLDRNTLLVTSDFGEGSLTRAEYPREVRRWTRGTPLADAPRVDAVTVEDMMITPMVLRDATRAWPMVLRARTFWRSQLLHIGPDGALHPSPLPEDAVLQGLVDGRLIAKLQADSETGPAGTLVAYAIGDLVAGRPAPLETVLTPPANGAIEGVASARSTLFVSLLEDVVGRIVALRRHGPGDWRSEAVPTPANSAVFLSAAEPGSDRLFYLSVGMTRPQTLHLYAPGEAVRDVASAPERFDPASFVVSQRFATSADGTRVPYFLVLPRNVDGPVPVMLYAYGGFRQSLVPGYVGPIAQFLLESGMGYAVANIRGGGEFGPAWHAAAVRENRQRAFDDLHAVAASLKTTGTANRVAIHGGSNGGLLVGAAYTQRPELYDAVVMAVPLADMKRYHKLLAGASWMDEYGNPDVPGDWAFLRRYSPYHNLTADATYPPVMFQTSTKDDRVHPGHARKMAARMAALGHDFDYYENIDGGHGGSADNSQAAHQAALLATWLRSKLAG